MRACIICGTAVALVDVYKITEIKLYGSHSNTPAELSKPTVYCNKHFMEKVWNKPKPQ